MTKVLATGGKGFIAGKLVERLRSRKGLDVRTFDIVDGQDLRDARAVDRAVQGCSAVFHLAAVADLNWARVHPIETMQINVEGTWNIANACSKHEAKLLFASTECIYGPQKAFCNSRRRRQ